MTQKFNRDDLVARLVRAGELEVSGEVSEEGAWWRNTYEPTTGACSSSSASLADLARRGTA